MQPELAKTYDPTSVETRLYEAWEKNGAFTAQRDPNKKPFVIPMPPPNITGTLHIGHSLYSIHDALTRFHRMLGESALYLPGTDHASIATEVRIIDMLAKEGITKEDLGREGFLERAWQWKEQYGGTIVKQLRRLGASCDWSRERFTLDEGLNRAVTEVFVRLYGEGLIYRGDRIINWCPVCRTALSDAEVEYEERDGHIWHIRYEGEDGASIIVATTRPETMLGDTAVAVHPDDERYRHLIGKQLTLPLRNRPIPIVADTYVEMDFGSGAVKITPAHDPNDFEVAQRHDLPIDRVMNDDGTMTEACGRYAGLPALEARKLIVEDLKALGLLVKVENYTHNVGECYRCHHTVEPLVSRQWFVRMKPLTEPAIAAVKDGEVRFTPERFTKVYMNWMDNIRDWCISRQLWWGHRIPAYYCACGETIVARTMPDACPKCGGKSFSQDEDVLDTWFSSALWPFSTLGWPDETPDFEYFYPGHVLVTAYDIIFFWVARMIFSGIKFTGKPPFADVLMTGLIRDAQGRKMSKSLDNGIDPLDMIDKYGADALRFSLAFGVSPGNDIRFSEEKVEAARNFTNKIWNAARFSLMHLSEKPGEVAEADLSLADRWILTRLAAVTREVTEHMHTFDTGLATQKLYDFVWSELCDWYLELAKSALFDGTEAQKNAARATLYKVLCDTMKLLHPIMPFITSEIYAHLPGTEGELMLSQWPEPAATYPREAAEMEAAMDVIRAIRNLRAEMNVPMGRKARAYLRPAAGMQAALEASLPYLQKLAAVSEAHFMSATETEAPEGGVAAVCPAAEIFLPLGDLVDLDKERARLQKEHDNLAAEIARGRAKLENPGFTAKAPAAVVEEERRKLAEREAMLETLGARIAAL